MPRRDLARTTVFLDFDGTITQHDSSAHLLDRTVGEAWRPIGESYRRGAISSRECLERQWALIQSRDEEHLREVVREVPLDPHFPVLVEMLRQAHAEVVVLSDGYGFYAEEVCRREGLALLSNSIDWTAWSVSFGTPPEACQCPGCGTCKPAAIRAAHQRGRTTVLVGDGTSDRRGARVADEVFATNDLAAWCATAKVPYRPFASLADVCATFGPDAVS